MSSFKVTSSDAPVFGPTMTKADFGKFALDFQRFGYKASFNLAKIGAATIGDFAEWDGEKGRCAKAGFTEAQCSEARCAGTPHFAALHRAL